MGTNVRYNHDPMVVIPNQLGVSKLAGTNANHGILCIQLERVSTINGVRDILSLLCTCIGGIHGNNPIRLVGEESGCVIDIYHDTAAEDLSIFSGEESDRLVFPMIEIC